jgi:imidazole glycerol phosphate synthase subunit HisF
VQELAQGLTLAEVLAAPVLAVLGVGPVQDLAELVQEPVLAVLAAALAVAHLVLARLGAAHLVVAPEMILAGAQLTLKCQLH